MFENGAYASRALIVPIDSVWVSKLTKASPLKATCPENSMEDLRREMEELLRRVGVDEKRFQVIRRFRVTRRASALVL